MPRIAQEASSKTLSHKKTNAPTSSNSRLEPMKKGTGVKMENTEKTTSKPASKRGKGQLQEQISAKKEIEEGEESIKAVDNKRKGRAQEETEDEEDSEDEKSTKPARKKRQGKEKGKAAKSSKASEKAEKSLGEDNWLLHQQLACKHHKYIGAHTSAAGGVENSVTHCRRVNGMAFAMFLKSQRKWDSKPMEPSNIKNFKENCKDIMDLQAFGGSGGQKEKDSKYSYILPHGSYLINLANPDEEKRKKAYGAFLDDLCRCEQLGIMLYNFHPGSTVGECSMEEGIKHIADAINRAHEDTSSVVIVLENMAGQGNVIGSKFEDLRDIIKLVHNKERVGVCLDTCHLFAAGYDIRVGDDVTSKKQKSSANAFDATLKEFDRIVGNGYLRSVHLNDSKSELGSCLDRHENIGKGHIGIGAFSFIMNDDRFNDIPIVLETPDEKKDSQIWKDEIKLLYSFIRQ